MINGQWGVDVDPTAQGRIHGARPVAVLDIGSNSVRLVVYERHARALTPLYNEKFACSLGRGVAASGRIADENITRALVAIRRFAQVVELIQVGSLHVLATSAVREAENGPDFAQRVAEIMGMDVHVLSGEEEAHYAALGVVAGIPDFVGIVGDLGGGSLEFSAVKSGHDRMGETLELGAIRLQDDSDNSPEKARKIARRRLKESVFLEKRSGSSFAAIGGAWRALAKLHQARCKYPLHIVHHYSADAGDIIALCDAVVAAGEAGERLPGMGVVSSSRRALLPFGAAAMGEVLRAGGFSNIVFSALGVREGYLFDRLDADARAVDPLLQGAQEVSILRSRSPAHADDLIVFTDKFMKVSDLAEGAHDVRLRQAACMLSDIGWRGLPDYRGEQSIDQIAYGAFTGIDHHERAFLCECLAVRYMGLRHKSLNRAILALAGDERQARARILGTLFRVAYPMSAAMPGVLPRMNFTLDGRELILRLPEDLAFLNGERLRLRLSQLADVAGYSGGVVRLV